MLDWLRGKKEKKTKHFFKVNCDEFRNNTNEGKRPYSHPSFFNSYGIAKENGINYYVVEYNVPDSGWKELEENLKKLSPDTPLYTYRCMSCGNSYFFNELPVVSGMATNRNRTLFSMRNGVIGFLCWNCRKH